MESTAIKLEPGTSAVESVAVILTEIDSEYPFIKKECSESYFENNSGEVSTTEHSYLEGITIKKEPGNKEEVFEISFSETGFEPDIKKEALEDSQSNFQTAGSIKVERLSFKVVPGPREEDGEEVPCIEIDIELPDVKKDCLKRFQRITQPIDSMPDLKTHSVGKPISCSYCNYSCFYKSKLEHHLRTHTGEKPFSCSDCSYSCSQKCHLTVHMRIHSREKPFTCSNCSYSCLQKGNLTRHMLTHRREKPFTCSNCSYACTQKGYLKKHMRTHGGDKPFSCSDCKYSCYLKQSLTRHTLTHSGEKPFSCSDCKYACSRKESLTRHKRTHSRV